MVKMQGLGTHCGALDKLLNLSEPVSSVKDQDNESTNYSPSSYENYVRKRCEARGYAQQLAKVII